MVTKYNKGSKGEGGKCVFWEWGEGQGEPVLLCRVFEFRV